MGLQGRFLGFCSAMVAAAFAYGNVQVVAMAGAETQKPRKSIPAALKKTFARVILFYVASIFVMSLTIPANDKRLYLPSGNVSRSPFVIAFSGLGSNVRFSARPCTSFSQLLQALPSVVNAIVRGRTISNDSCLFVIGSELRLQLGERLFFFGFPYTLRSSPRWSCTIHIPKTESFWHALYSCCRLCQFRDNCIHKFEPRRLSGQCGIIGILCR